MVLSIQIKGTTIKVSIMKLIRNLLVVGLVATLTGCVVPPQHHQPHHLTQKHNSKKSMHTQQHNAPKAKQNSNANYKQMSAQKRLL